MTTETIVDAIQHTRSGAPGGMLTLTVVYNGRATRVEVIDQGCVTGHPHVRDDAEQWNGILTRAASRGCRVRILPAWTLAGRCAGAAIGR